MDNLPALCAGVVVLSESLTYPYLDPLFLTAFRTRPRSAQNCSLLMSICTNSGSSTLFDPTAAGGAITNDLDGNPYGHNPASPGGAVCGATHWVHRPKGSSSSAQAQWAIPSSPVLRAGHSSPPSPCGLKGRDNLIGLASPRISSLLVAGAKGRHSSAGDGENMCGTTQGCCGCG
mgnify:CR=1 FL=1